MKSHEGCFPSLEPAFGDTRAKSLLTLGSHETYTASSASNESNLQLSAGLLGSNGSAETDLALDVEDLTQEEVVIRLRHFRG